MILIFNTIKEEGLKLFLVKHSFLQKISSRSDYKMEREEK